MEKLLTNIYKLDIGCGLNKKSDFTGIDIFDYSNIYINEFICGSVPEVLKNFADNSIEEIYTSHFIEHIPQDRVIETFNEIYRIIKVGGLFEIFVPPTTGRGAFCDPNHRSYWNDLSFRYYDKSWEGYWLSESYGIKCNFKQLKIELENEISLHVILEKV